MAVIIGDIHRSSEAVAWHTTPLNWLRHQVGNWLSSPSSPSPFPERIWRRHSALLDAGWKRKRHHS